MDNKKRIRVAVSFDNFGQWAVNQQIVDAETSFELGDSYREGQARSILRNLGAKPSLAIDVIWLEAEVDLPRPNIVEADSIVKQRLDELRTKREEIQSRIDELLNIGPENG
jgi:hypothetical protein